MIGSTIAHYQVLSRLGAGGMGEVYLAEDTRLHRRVALKILPAEFTSDADRIGRFEREARAVSSLNHPNILTIYDVGATSDIHYIVTEFIEGQTLRQRLEKRSLPISEVLEIAIQIASALQSAHTAGIVHRDIKPDNVMLRPDGYVKVLDFGLAKLRETRKPEVGMRNAEQRTRSQTSSDIHPSSFSVQPSTSLGIVMGTAAYMSPEQARGLEVDARSDIFSLGIVLYEMIAGRPPFIGQSVSDIIAAILRTEPHPLSAIVASVPSELEHSIARALYKDFSERYQSIGEMLAVLKTIQRQPEADAAATLIRDPANTLPDISQAFTGNAPGVTAPRRTRIRRAIDSLAVLPLVNASDDANLEYLAEGITESVINSLSQLPKLRVVARSTVFRYIGQDIDPQQIGESLRVRAVVSGRMLQIADQLLVKVELLDVARQTHLWGEQFRCNMSDIFELQEEMAREVSDKLRLKLTGEDKKKLARRWTENTEAYHLYLKGRYFTNTKRTEDWLRKGIEYFQQAIDLDPNYALAWTGIADAYAFLASSTGGWQPRDAYPKALAAAQRALALDDSLSEAHCSLGFSSLLFKRDFAAAERAFKRAMELNPNYANAHDGYGFYLKATGQHDKAIRACMQSARLDPLSLFASLSLGWAYYFARRYDEAIAHGLKVLEIDPDFPFAWKFLGMTYGQQGALDAAIDALEKAVTLAPDVPDFRAHLGYVYGLANHIAEAEQILKQLHELATQRYVPSYYFALVTLGLGRMNDALEWLGKAYEEGSGFLAFLKVEPMLERLQGNARFQQLLNIT